MSPPADPAEQDPRDDLSRYVRQRNDDGLSYRRMALRAVDPTTERTLGFRWLSKLAAREIAKAPEPWQLRAVATALEVPVEVVQELAARQWFDFEVGEVRLGPDELVFFRVVKDLPEEKKNLLRELAAEFVRDQRRQQEQAGHDEDGEATG